MTQDDHVIVEHLAVEIAELQADNNREQWAENDGDDDGILRTVATTLAKIGFDEAGISGVRPLILEMIERGEISVRSVLFNLPPGKKTDISADMEGWYMSQEDAKKVRGYLIPGKRENNSTAPSGTTEKDPPDVALDDDDRQGEAATPVASDQAETPAERRAKHDMTTERGCRRLVLENWDTIEELHGPMPKCPQIRRIVVRNLQDGEKEHTLKTFRNVRDILRKAGLIP